MKHLITVLLLIVLAGPMANLGDQTAKEVNQELSKEEKAMIDNQAKKSEQFKSSIINGGGSLMESIGHYRTPEYAGLNPVHRN